MIAFRIYLMPIIGTGTRHDPRRPKYSTDLGTATWQMMDMGIEPWCLLGVKDLEESVDTFISSQADVSTLPFNLDQTVSAALNQVRNALEGMNIPATWVVAGSTFREVLRMVAGLFQFLQRLHGITPTRLFSSGITLNTRFNQLPVQVRTDMITAGQSINLDTSSLSGNTTLRVILKTLADSWKTTPLMLYGESI